REDGRRYAVVGETRRVVGAPLDLGQPLAAQPLDLRGGKGGGSGHLGQQVAAGAAVVREQAGGEVADVPVGAGGEIAAQTLDVAGDVHGAPPDRPLVEKRGRQGR